MEIIVFILIVIACVACHKLAKEYNRQMEDKYCQGCINWFWTVVVAVSLVATILTIGEETFWIFLLLTICLAALSVWLCSRKVKAWGASSKETVLGCAAQIASVIGIAAAIIFVMALIFGDSGKKRRRR